MEEKRNSIDRRNFLKTVGAAGLSSVLTSSQTKGTLADANAPDRHPDPDALEKSQAQKLKKIPRRKLGKTRVEVSCLALGAIFNVVENQTVLRNAFRRGVTCWDTAPDYSGPNSELGIGKFIAKNPKLRKKLFISTKASDALSIDDVEKRLQTSLKRMNTDYIDLYHIMDRSVHPGFTGHGLSDPAQLTDEVKQWARSAKKRKLIRLFGFSTHKNMAQCLAAAAKLDWIDVVMPVYNFRLMLDDKMQAAVEACHKKGIGVIAMKIQAYPQKLQTDREKKLVTHFLRRGFTEVQAKIKVVLQDKRISSACIRMENVGVLAENVAAALDKAKLSRADIKMLRRYAEETCNGYCAGCAHICDSALPAAPYISDIMRYLMYYNSYGDTDRAKRLFARIPHNVKDKLMRMDYKLAEARCPQHLPISEFVTEAVRKLT